MRLVRNRSNNDGVNEMLAVASFLGHGAYSNVLSMLGAYKNRLNPSMRKFPKPSPKVIFATLQEGKFDNDPKFRVKKLDQLDSIASLVKQTGEIPPLQDKRTAYKLDRFIYAQDDQYK